MLSLVLPPSARAVHSALPCNPNDLLTPPSTFHAPVYCGNENVGTCDCSASISCTPGASPYFTTEKSVLWMMTDDQGYSMYRFMHGPGAVDDPSTIVVDDLASRYRNSEGNHGQSFVFGLDRVSPVDLGVCADGTCAASYCKYDGGPLTICPSPACPDDCLSKPCSSDVDCRILRTPTLDRLATKGAVFPVAHVAGHSCKPAWRGIASGRHLKDITDLVSSGEMQACECPATCSGATPCPDASLTPTTDDDCPNTGAPCSVCGACGNARSLTRLLHTNDPPYATFLQGKLRGATNGLQGYESCQTFYRKQENEFGTIREANCGITSACADHIRNDYLDDHDGVTGEIDTEPPASLIDPATGVLADLVGWLRQLPLDPDTNELVTPFFVGWAPESPHDGTGTPAPDVITNVYCAPGGCTDAYGGRHKDAAENLAEVTRDDYMLAVVIDQLKRTCVCHAGSATSLWDMTAVVHHSDHGGFMPETKQSEPADNQMRGESGYRTTLVMSRPEHRSGAIKPEVYREHMVQTVDVFRTMIGHFDDAPDPGVPSDLKGKDLAELLAQSGACVADAQCTAPATCTGGWCRQACATDADCGADVCVFDGEQHSCRRAVRDVMVTQGSDPPNNDAFRGWFVQPRPGRVGICAADAGATLPEVPGGQLIFCMDADDCPGVPCQIDADGDVGAKICLNRHFPGRPIRCETDRDCDVGLCKVLGTTCPTRVCDPEKPGAFFDQRGSCSAGCVPEGVCAPPEVKYGAKAQSTVPQTVDTDHVWVYELHSDPDETVDLTPASLGACLECLLRECAEEWEKWGDTGPNDEPIGVAECFDPARNTSCPCPSA